MSFPILEKAIQHDFLVSQGSTFEQTLFFDDFLIENNFNFRGHIRRHHDERKLFGEFEFKVIDERTVMMRLSAHVTEALPSGLLVYDVEIYTLSDDTDEELVTRFLEGHLKVSPEVTKTWM
jgi:hypothetical protein